MALAAAQIISAIAQRLRGATDADAKVYASRSWPLSERELPAWRIVAEDEDVEPLSMGADRLQQHRLQVGLKGYSLAVADLDASLHTLASQALAAVFPAVPPSDPADELSAIPPGKLHLTLRRIERHMQTEGQAVLGMVHLTLMAVYRTRQTQPDALA